MSSPSNGHDPLAGLDAARLHFARARFFKRPELVAALDDVRILVVGHLEERERLTRLERQTAESERALVAARAALEKIQSELELRARTIAQREDGLRDAEQRLAATLGRVNAAEERERAATRREKEMIERETRVGLLEQKIEAALAEHDIATKKAEAHTAELLARLKEQHAAAEGLRTFEARLRERETLVDKWKVDLGEREKTWQQRQEEIFTLERKKEELLAEIGGIREHRLADLAAKERTLDDRETQLRAKEASVDDTMHLLAERNDRLAEQKARLDAFEEELRGRATEVTRLGDEVHVRDLRVKDLERQLAAMELIRRDLQSSIDKLQRDI